MNFGNLMLSENTSATEWQTVYDYTQKLVLSGICQNLGGSGIKEYCLIGIEFLFCRMKRVLEISCTKSTYLTLLNCIQVYPEYIVCLFSDDYNKASDMIFFSFGFPVHVRVMFTLYCGLL